jgi:hypothetical protein
MARRLVVKPWMYRTSRLERWAREMQCRADGEYPKRRFSLKICRILLASDADCG